MTIKAVQRNGVIQPLESIPSQWQDGQELIVEQPETIEPASRIEQWSREMEAAARAIPSDEHDRFREALAEIEHESKEAVRRKWGLK